MGDTPAAVFVGEAMVELTEAAEDRLAWTFAGDALNCAAAFAARAPHAHVQLATGLGDDPISREFVAFCASHGVDTRNSPVIPGRTLGLYWIRTTNGERTFTYWRGESAARMALRSGDAIPKQTDVSLFALSGITLAVAGPGMESLLEVARQLGEAGAMVGFDTNYRRVLWGSARDALTAAERAAAAADVVIASADDVAELWECGPERFGERMAELGVAETVLTSGPGKVVVRVGDSTIEHMPPAVEQLDTTGAGDAFFGTYLAARIDGLPPAEAAAEAATVGARVVQSQGALSYLADQSTT